MSAPLRIGLMAAFALSAVSAPTSAQAGSSHCETVGQCRSLLVHQQQALAWQKHDRARLIAATARRWHASVVAAVRLAANVSGVSFRRLWTISGCESTHDPLDRLGQFWGLFQLGRYHRSMPDMRGLSPWDPYVNAMHAALYIARHGESQWSCRSDGHVAY
jgi:hypothetical protein